jgi:hypothetical protein
VREEVKGRSAPQSRSFASVDEMKKAVGTEVGVSGWLEISQQVPYLFYYLLFILVTYFLFINELNGVGGGSG